MPSAGNITFMFGLYFRYKDSTHLWNLAVENDASAPYISLAIDGSAQGPQAIIFTTSAISELRVVAVGNNVKVYWNGALKYDVTNAANNTEKDVCIVKYVSVPYPDVPLDEIIIN
jgi:hypothetical protein